MEANMSPNLSSAHFSQNTLLYEQVIYSLMNLVGIGSSIHRESLRTRLVKFLIEYNNFFRLQCDGQFKIVFCFPSNQYNRRRANGVI